MSRMTITEIEVFLLKRPLASSMHISRGGFQVRQHALVKVHTDSGITGLGEGIGNAPLIKTLIDSHLGPESIGMDPMNIEHLRDQFFYQPVYFERKGSVVCAASAIEMACWDIKGKALDVPCYELMGGLYRKHIPAYASDVYWEEDIQNMADNARRIQDLGFDAIKVHVGWESPERDTARIEAVRKAIGQDARLMIDLNAGYDLHEARRAAKLWSPFDLYWLEEPLKPDQVDALADLRQAIDIPIAAGENEFFSGGFHQMFRQRALDVAMPDLGRAGGIQETRNICAVALAAGIPVSPHNFSSGVLLAATAHLMAATPNTTLLEMDTSGNAVYDDLILDGVQFKDGMFEVNDSPGLGVEIPESIIEKHAVA